MEEKKNITVQITKELDKRLRIAAANEDIGKSELVRRILEKGIKEYE